MYNEITDLMEARTTNRRVILENLKGIIEEADEQAAKYKAQVEEALDLTEVSQETALADLNYRAQTRRKAKTEKELAAVEAEPLFSEEEVNSMLRQLNTITDTLTDPLYHELLEEYQKMSAIIDKLEEIHDNNRSVSKSLLQSVKKWGLHRDSNGVLRSPNNYPKDWSIKKLREALKELNKEIYI